MGSGDFLNIVLIIGFILIVCCVIYVAYYFVEALKSLKGLAENVDEFTESIRGGLKLKVFAALPAIFIGLVSKLLKRR